MGAGRILRRSFLGLGLVAAGGLAVGYYHYRRPWPNPLTALAAEGEAAFNPFVIVSEAGPIRVIVPRAEMGQGVQTTLAALVAEEMELEMDQISVEHGPPAPAYYNARLFEEGSPFAFFDRSFAADVARDGLQVAGRMLGIQATGGSTSTIDAFERMRAAGAGAREMLRAAAGKVWLVPADRLRVAGGLVLDPLTGRTLSYQQLATTAGSLSPPRNIALKDPRAWRLLGRSLPDVLGPAKVTGQPIYGIDLELPGMLHAAVNLSPRFGAGALGVDRLAALAVPGVRDVVDLDTHLGRGFGVIASNTWAAFRGAEALSPVWDDAPYPPDQEGIAALYDAALDRRDPDFTMGGRGDPAARIADADAEAVLEAQYAVPFLAHATMEPMSAVAQLRAGALELWCGNQAPGIVRQACARQLGLDRDAVTVHTLPMGGGFGRRAEIDFAVFAAELARYTEGRPVKLTYSRAADMRAGAYRPAAAARFRARLDADRVDAIEATIAAPSVTASAMGRFFPNLPSGGPDKTVVDGAFNQPYRFGSSAWRAMLVDLPIPIGFWRAVGNSYNGFFLESFLDEAAARLGRDPVALRLDLLGDDRRFAPARRVIEDVAARSRWGDDPGPGRGRGIAFVLSFGAWVAQVVEVADTADGIRIEKVWCSADLGRVLDPRNVENQIMSGIVFGLSQAVGQKLTFADGMVEQTNFDSFPMLDMARCPDIDIRLFETAPHMGGAGEIGVPPAAPALANAVFAATGRRIRRLPLSDEIDFA